LQVTFIDKRKNLVPEKSGDNFSAIVHELLVPYHPSACIKNKQTNQVNHNQKQTADVYYEVIRAVA
jgi:hypothetical protein